MNYTLIVDNNYPFSVAMRREEACYWAKRIIELGAKFATILVYDRYDALIKTITLGEETITLNKPHHKE